MEGVTVGLLVLGTFICTWKVGEIAASYVHGQYHDLEDVLLDVGMIVSTLALIGLVVFGFLAVVT